MVHLLCGTPGCCIEGKLLLHKEATTSQGGDERGKWQIVLRTLKLLSDTLSLSPVDSVVGVCSCPRTLVVKREGVASRINKAEVEKGRCLAMHTDLYCLNQQACFAALH